VSADAPVSKWSLFREEEAAWGTFHGVAEAIPRETLMEAGTYGSWSAKDVLAHVGSWHAEAATIVEQLRMGTYRGWDQRVEDCNRAWWEAWRDQDPDAAVAHLHASRYRMLEEMDLLPDDRLEGTAVEWFRDSGVSHYEEHLPALRAWVP
jgi:Mycothiol maleylpyruvate isomerase N-terminal domain